jgi:glycosyltransferase involved in cell wall biosynthesis
MPPLPRALIFPAGPGDRYRAGRTLRALKAAGVAAEDLCGLPPPAIEEALAGGGPVWFVRAGAWPCRPPAYPPPGPPVCALGVPRPGPADPVDAEAGRWAALQAATGGDYSLLPDLPGRLPPVVSAFLSPAAVAGMARRLAGGVPLPGALHAELAGGHRLVRYAALDVHADAALRVVQLVTSLQRGGAERIALDLTRGLARRGLRTLLVALGRPSRGAFPTPPGAIDLSAVAGWQVRVGAAHRAAVEFAADLVHAHLLHGEDVAALAALGLPVVTTAHNARPGWPPGLESLRPADAALVLACAQAVEADLRATGLAPPIRTAWNGVEFGPFEQTPELLARAGAWRRSLGFGHSDFVLLALANPRPQKRLDRLPAVLAAARAELARRGVRREARLVIAGEGSAASEAARQAETALRDEVARLGLGSHVRLVGAVADVPRLLAAADVLVSASAYEGLSLAHLEALAAGLPVVATDAGGTAEVARDNPAVTVLPVDAPAGRFADALAGLAAGPPPAGGRDAAAVHFDHHRMLERHAWLYPRAVEAARGPRQGDGLLLVINNFSTGGAQASARRLLLGLAADGVRVRAAVLQEPADDPTPGRRALLAAGIDVLALPPADECDPADVIAELLTGIDADPPAAVLLWNTIPAHKVLLADALLDVPVYDVSPGEMFFESLGRYFARPRPGWPYRTGRDYGARLAGVVVKYRGEADAAAALLGVPVHVIPNGVPLGPPPAPRPVRSPLVIGTAARLSPRKRLEDLLAAVRLAHPRLPPYVLRVAGNVERGSDEYATWLRELAAGLPVEWAGEVADVRSFLDGLELFAQVSEPAGCPNASLEAMAAGLPVVATDVGGAAEQVADGVTGRLVPPRDAAAFAAALAELAGDGQKRRACGDAGRRRAEERFDVRRMVADYRRLCFPTARPGRS